VESIALRVIGMINDAWPATGDSVIPTTARRSIRAGEDEEWSGGVMEAQAGFGEGNKKIALHGRSVVD